MTSTLVCTRATQSEGQLCKAMATQFNKSLSGLFNQPGYAKATQRIGPSQAGTVEFMFQKWTATLYPECQELILPTQEVKVVGRQGSTLWVTPAHYGFP